MNITLTREEAQQVLDAFESATPKYTRARKDGKSLGGELDYWKLEQHKRMPAIETLRARLSAPEPEPVAGYRWEEGRTPPSVTFTAPPQREWQGLTDEEAAELCHAPIAVIEAKLKEKNASHL
jgi:hypothetical protein